VLTSPWPESLYAFDRMWPRLSGIARLLAIDLPGFGRSGGYLAGSTGMGRT
jgi:pimeloyl-ACP methyl ester carboxylesterase